jgi:hypothetical protein
VAGRELPPTSAFADDDGAADPALRAALGAWAADPGALPEVVAALRTARVLVPVVTQDRSATAVALAAPDGRTALPVFSDLAALAAWHPDARPVPTPAAQAAAAALAEGWELMVVDPGGPVTVLVPGPAVRALATGSAWNPAVSRGVVRDDVVDAIRRAARVPQVRWVRVVPGSAAEVAVVLGVRPGLGRGELDSLLADLGRHPVAAEIDSLEIRVERALSPDGGDEAPGPARRARSPRRSGRPAPPG